MFGIEMGEPELPLAPDRIARARAWFEEREAGARRLVGLNTGSGGRWESKKLSVPLTVELACALDAARPGELGFVLLGGADERARNAELAARLGPRVALFDTGCDNSLLEFAAFVGELSLLITSDSLALHIAVARKRPVLCFFAPTSAAEIELYGRGRKVLSTAPDYCSYRKDADTSTLTVERLLGPALELLEGR
jgi:heptosyltransferase-2